MAARGPISTARAVFSVLAWKNESGPALPQCILQNANCVRIATASNFDPTSAVETGEACLDTVPCR